MQELAAVQAWEPRVPARLGLANGQKPARKEDRSLVSEIFETNGLTRWEVTAALEGSPVAVCVKEGVVSLFAGDEVVDQADAANPFVADVDRMRLHEALSSLGESMVLQGVLAGSGASRFFVLYDIYDLDRGIYLPPSQRKAVWMQVVVVQRKMGVTDALAHAPMLRDHVSLGDLGIASVEKLIAFADGDAPAGTVRQGVVFRRFDARFGFKVLSTPYLLKSQLNLK